MAPAPEVRSFRAVFALERRIYRIDTLRLHPAGIPLRGIAYAIAFVAVAVTAGALPPTRWLDPLAPWWLRELAFPIAAATLLGSLRVDGRPFHLTAIACLRHLAAPRVLHGLRRRVPRCDRWAPPAILLVPDGSDARFRSLRYRGPGVVLVHGPHVRREFSGRRRVAVALHPAATAGTGRSALELAAGVLLEVHAR